MTKTVLMNVRHDLATPAEQHPMMAPAPVRVVHRGDVLAQPEISADTAPSPTPNRTSTVTGGNARRQRRPSRRSMLNANHCPLLPEAEVGQEDARHHRETVAAPRAHAQPFVHDNRHYRPQS